MNSLRVIAVAALALLAHARTHHWTPDTYPNPKTNFTGCGRPSASLICDPDGVLAPDAADAVDALLRNVADGRKPFAQAKCGVSAIEGFTVGVAVMHRMYESADPPAAAHRFASALQDAWALGDPACDNGALLLLTVLEGQMVLAAGAGVAALLPDAAVAHVLGAAKEDMLEGSDLPATGYARLHVRARGAAVEAAVYGLGMALATAVHSDDDDGKGGGSGSGGWHLHVSALVEEILAGLATLAVFGEGLRRWRRRRTNAQRRYQECCASIEDIQQDHASSLRGDTAHSCTAQSCAFCLCRCHAHDAAEAVALTVREGSIGGGGDTDSEAELHRPLAPARDAAAGLAGDQMLMLPCGHVFCDSCVASRLDQGSTGCPVCCAPILDTSTGAHASTASGVPLASMLVATQGADDGSSAAATTAAGASDARRYGAMFTGDTTGRDALLLQLRQAWSVGQARRIAGVLRPELEFRLQRLQRLYPEYVTTEMTAAWGRDLRNGRQLDAQQLRVLHACNPCGHRSSLMGGSMLRGVLMRVRALRPGRIRR